MGTNDINQAEPMVTIPLATFKEMRAKIASGNVKGLNDEDESKSLKVLIEFLNNRVTKLIESQTMYETKTKIEISELESKNKKADKIILVQTIVIVALISLCLALVIYG